MGAVPSTCYWRCEALLLALNPLFDETAESKRQSASLVLCGILHVYRVALLISEQQTHLCCSRSFRRCDARRTRYWSRKRGSLSERTCCCPARKTKLQARFQARRWGDPQKCITKDSGALFVRQLRRLLHSGIPPLVPPPCLRF